MLVLCLGGLAAVVAQVRCVDAAREAALLAARGDGAAVEVALRVAPPRASVDVRRDGGFVVAEVSVAAPLLPGLSVSARAVAAVEASA